MARHYIMEKTNKDKICYMEVEHLDGFTFKPVKSSDYDDGVMVVKMVLFKPTFIEDVLKRKIKNKLNKYLALILSNVDEDDETSDAQNVRAALNDLTRYRQLIINNYRKYLESKYVEILLTKISMIEEELKSKLVCLLYDDKEKEDEQEVHHKNR